MVTDIFIRAIEGGKGSQCACHAHEDSLPPLAPFRGPGGDVASHRALVSVQALCLHSNSPPLSHLRPTLLFFLHAKFISDACYMDSSNATQHAAVKKYGSAMATTVQDNFMYLRWKLTISY